METFSVKFRAGSLDLNAIVTEYDHHQRFKVELVTEESDPILLTRLPKGEWTVLQSGRRNFTERDFKELERAIELQLNEKYSAKNILVLTDFSDEAFNGATYAVALAQQLDAHKIILYHSYESIAVPAIDFAPISGIAAASHKLSIEKITELKKELLEKDTGQVQLQVRTDERSLINAVNVLGQQLNIGVVVVGITGKSNLERILIGSNTLDLAKYCRAPLLIVPSVARFKLIKTVVFACDLDRVSEATPVLAIKTFIHALGAKLLILNVDSDNKHFSSDTIRELGQLHELWDGDEPEYHYINHEDIALGIMEFVHHQAVDLVITIPKQYGFFESLFHRSMTRKLAYHTHLPLLLFREDS